MKQQISQCMIAVIASIASAGIESPAHAYSIYFGEDLGLGEDTRLLSTPQADTARNNFLSNLAGSVGTQTLERFSPGSSTPPNISFPGAGTATLNGGGFVSNVSTGTNGSGRYPISGNQFYDTGGDAFSLSFSQPVASFGFYGTDIGDFSGQLTLSLLNSSNTTKTLTVSNSINGLGGSALYYAVIAQDPDEVFTRATFGTTLSGSNIDVFGFDDFTIGSLEQVGTPTPIPTPPVGTPTPIPTPPVGTPAPVPEPSSVLGTLVFGALSIGSVLKGKLKRKKTQQA